MAAPSEQALDRAAELIAAADALVIGAGAGMSVDSGLPAFRTPDGFWRAFPPAAELGLRFEELANPVWFRTDPTLAWGFYGWRLNAYRRAVPHRGHEILRRLAVSRPGGAFVVTTNVDGLFQRAGFAADAVHELHGTILQLQCTAECGVGLFPAPDRVEVDERTFRARPPLPSCTGCGTLARPNVLMFGDGYWDPSLSMAQRRRYEAFLHAAGGQRLCLIELGAGTSVPTLRLMSDWLAAQRSVDLVRINPDEPEVGVHGIGIAAAAAAALEAIETRLGR